MEGCSERLQTSMLLGSMQLCAQTALPPHILQGQKPVLLTWARTKYIHYLCRSSLHISKTFLFCKKNTTWSGQSYPRHTESVLSPWNSNNNRSCSIFWARHTFNLCNSASKCPHPCTHAHTYIRMYIQTFKPRKGGTPELPSPCRLPVWSPCCCRKWSERIPLPTKWSSSKQGRQGSSSTTCRRQVQDKTRCSCVCQRLVVQAVRSFEGIEEGEGANTS